MIFLQASEVLQLVRFPTMNQHELCEVAKHPVVVGDLKVKVSLCIKLSSECNRLCYFKTHASPVLRNVEAC